MSRIKRKQVCLRVDPVLWQRLQNLARATGRSVITIVELSIKSYIRREILGVK